MNIQITGKQIDLTEPLKQYAEEKIGKLSRYFDTVMDAHIVFSVNKHRQKVEVNLLVNGINISAESTTQDMYASIDTVTDKIERQVKRYKNKIKSHKPRQQAKDMVVNMNVFAAESFEEREEQAGASEPKVIKSSSFKVKPMSVDEAVMQMNLISNEFLVFRNADSDQINVIYQRKDGNYGLVQPEA
ncbi:ribosome-associated translation inhibitor RaiA [Desulfurispirillum indicum]|uniref:ribosome hibernation-promoting factor, HPF/YfiA family n=1 Tax=Desulfurispirillum indicum TaxID=936456 RepID=UPI001CFAC31B|nr:ribosome-associated translation inhibitor RaiA [Desulfurispirillum indicum]UCZ57237.1 ribosome-associated translation inhibitor RaiA [Desulfurispirillum indicum]